MSQKTKHFADDLFVGARLGAARTKAGITLEQAASDTRIRVQRLREIEVDDFSGFAHPTYARLFLIDYAEYLGVPVDEIRPLLPAQTKAASAGFQYLDALGRANEAEADYAMRQEPGRRFRILRFLAFLVVAILVIAGGLYFWSTIKKIERISPRAVAGQPAAAPGGAEEVVVVAVDENAAPPTDDATGESESLPLGTPAPTPFDWQTAPLWDMVITTGETTTEVSEVPSDE